MLCGAAAGAVSTGRTAAVRGAEAGPEGMAGVARGGGAISALRFCRMYSESDGALAPEPGASCFIGSGWPRM